MMLDVDLFGFEDNGWVTVGGAVVDGSCWVIQCLQLWVEILF